MTDPTTDDTTSQSPAGDAPLRRLSPAQLDEWRERGYFLMRGLFSAERIAEVGERFDAIAEAGEPIPGHWDPKPEADGDPLKRYPRMMHPHRFDALSKQVMLDPTVREVLHDLLGEDAVACQTMYYYKPPGAAGQALHQDNFYLAVQPGLCLGVWVAIDPADPDNGGMYLVPGSHRYGVICPDPEEIRSKSSSNLVDPPKGMKAEPTYMEPGDALIFSGSVIHGSGRNRSETRWRRSFISHYMPASSTHVNSNYFPIFDFEGNEIPYEAARDGGPCGEALAAYGQTYGVDALIH